MDTKATGTKTARWAAFPVGTVVTGTWRGGQRWTATVSISGRLVGKRAVRS